MDLKDHLVPIPLLWTGVPPIRPDCPGPHPALSCTLPGAGLPQLLWAACAHASPHSWKEFLPKVGWIFEQPCLEAEKLELADFLYLFQPKPYYKIMVEKLFQ